MAEPKTHPFREVFGTVVPEHEVFAICEHCGDFTAEGIRILSVASQLGHVIAANLVHAETPPDVVGFVLSVIVSAAATDLVQMKKGNAVGDAGAFLGLMPQVQEMLRDMASRIEPELVRVEQQAAIMAKEEIQGSC